MLVLAADVAAGFNAGSGDVALALRSLRRRQLELCRRLGDLDWQHPSRCELWSVHDVVRHVRDGCRLHVRYLRDGQPAFTSDDPFNARETPLRWLEETASQTPAETMAGLPDLYAEEADALDARMARGGDDRVEAPYGPVHWTILTAHVFWDAWVHDRDVTQPLGAAHASSPVEDGVVALYALLIASMPAAAASHPFEATVALKADEGRAYLVSVRPGHVTLRPDDGSGEAILRGDLAAVVDGLAGRGSELAAVLHGSESAREPLSWLRSRLLPAPAAAATGVRATPPRR